MGQLDVQPLVSETAMAQHCTEIIVDEELIEYGAPNEDMHLPHMAGEDNEETEVISMQDSVVYEAWRGWEDGLRMACRM